jgi:hypothetical protein
MQYKYGINLNVVSSIFLLKGYLDLNVFTQCQRKEVERESEVALI